MAARPVNAGTSVPFSAGTDGVSLTLEETGDDVLGTTETLSEYARAFGWRAIRLYPNVGASMRVSRGEVQDTGNRVPDERDEFVQFGGGDSASTRYPVDGGTLTVVSVAFAIDAAGNDIPASRLSFTATAQRTTIRASEPFFGAVNVRYISTARVFRYRPEAVAVSPENYSSAFSSALSRGFRFWLRQHGQVLAFFEGASATLEMRPLNVNVQESNLKELYRVTSKVQVNENGAWERHPNFGSGGTWGVDAPEQGGTFLEYERVHEIGFIRAGFGGMIDRDSRTVETEQGPVGSFTADYEVSFRPEQDFINTEFYDAYSRVSFDQVESDIRGRFPGVTGF